MGETPFAVLLTEDASRDLEELDDYWASRGEAWRGEKYYWDLRRSAERELSDLQSARRGRAARNCDAVGVQEILVFRGTYRILYEIDEASHTVSVLRFWHAHRDAPPLE